MEEYIENTHDNNMDLKNIQFNARHNLHATANTVDLFLCCKFSCAGCASYKMCTANTQNKSGSPHCMFHSVAAMQNNVQAY
jgi:hypothetical protein